MEYVDIIPWLQTNRKRIQRAIALFQKSFPSHPQFKEVCFAVSEFLTPLWTTVYDNGNPVMVNMLPIAIGLSESEGLPVWDSLTLARPTMDARLGMGNSRVRFTYRKLTYNRMTIYLDVTE